MKMITNKRGDKVISVYWFAIILIVAGGVFAMVYVFYGAPYDAREMEAEILINQVADCVSYAGRIDRDLVSNGQFNQNNANFLEGCHLLFNSSEWEEEQFYTEVYFYKPEDLNTPLLTIKKGNDKWLSYCEVQEKKEYEKLTKCVKKSFYSLDDLNNQYIIKILATVSKAEKNVKL